MLSVWFKSNSEIRSNVEVTCIFQVFVIFEKGSLCSPACPGSRLDWPGTELHLPLPLNSWDWRWASTPGSGSKVNLQTAPLPLGLDEQCIEENIWIKSLRINEPEKNISLIISVPSDKWRQTKKAEKPILGERSEKKGTHVKIPTMC